MVEVKERPKDRTGPRAQPARGGEAVDPAPPFRKVGVIGAGQMGNGIAHVCALSGFSVLLNDVSTDRVKSSLATINGNMARQVGKHLISEEDRKAALARITPAELLDRFADCDLVI